IATSFFAHQGKVALPDCLRTFGLLGAEESASTAQCGEPRPVVPHTQPAGADPAVSASKLIVSAIAGVAHNAAATQYTYRIMRNPLAISMTRLHIEGDLRGAHKIADGRCAS